MSDLILDSDVVDIRRK